MAFQLVVLCTPNLNIVTMKKLKELKNVVIKKVGGIPNPFEEINSQVDAQGNRPSWVGSGYTKLHLWHMIEYDIVYYIDADCLV
jgi:alpha-N-acetylglucosamine transferase